MAQIQYAGEYIVDECLLCTVGGLELDLRDQLASINIYEDIFTNSITGSISFVDTNNLTANASIVGQEKLKLVLVTPNASDDTSRDMAINFSDQPLHVYQIKSSINVNDRTKTFELAFTTNEIMRNNRIRVCQSYNGEPAKEIIKKVIRDPELLNSKKEFYYEETTNLFQMIAPNMRPFDFINTVAKRCLSKEYDFAPTFLFYETVRGYFFRTIDSMMDRKNPRFIYRELTPNTIPEGESRPNAAINLTNILNYEVLPTTDVMMNMRRGMYGSKLTMIDLVNKTKEDFEYNYFDDFQEDKHADAFNAYGSVNAPLASEARDDFQNRLSDYTESAIFMQAVDRDSPNGLFSARYEGQYDYTGTDIWLQRRKGRFSSLDSAITLRVEVPGNTTLQAGDLIGIEMRNQGILAEDKKDPYFSGRYLVRKLRHEFTFAEGSPKHSVYLDCVRDTIKQPYPSIGIGYADGGNSTEEIIPTGSESPNDVSF